MFNLLKIETIKAKRFIPFYAMVLYWVPFLFYTSYGTVKKGVYLFSTHECFSECIQDMSLSFVFAILAAWFISADFGNRTIMRSITTGSDRLKIIIAKLIPASIFIILFHTVFTIADTIGFGIHLGFSGDGFCVNDIAWVAVVYLQAVALVSVFEFICFICCNFYGAVLACTMAAFVCCNILRNYINAFWYDHSCFNFAESSSAADLIPCAVIAVITIAVMITATYLVFRKRDVA